MTDPATTPPTHVPHAYHRRTRRPGWVWLIPLVALGFAGWLAFDEWVLGPRSLTVHFPSAEGIKPGAPVRYRGVQVGSVETIALDADLGGATLVLDMTALKGRLGEGTRIWIERPGLAPGQLGSLISGPYLAIAPAGEGEIDELDGLAEAPIPEPDEPGLVLVLTDEDAEGLKPGAPVRFRGMDVGRVLGRRFAEDGSVEFPVFVEGEHAGLVREATVFWRTGGLAVSTGAGGLDVDLPSLTGIATGAVAFETPEVLEGAPAEAGQRFPLWPKRDVAATATTGPRIPYLTVFAEPVGDIAPGAPVTLAGKVVGRVAGTTLEVAPDGSGLVTPLTLVIDARSMGIDTLETLDSREALRQQLDAIMGRLVQVGMRAQVAEGGIVFGARSIELVIDSAAAPAAFSPDAELPIIPAAKPAPGYGGLPATSSETPSAGAAESGPAASGTPEGGASSGGGASEDAAGGAEGEGAATGEDAAGGEAPADPAPAAGGSGG